MGPSAASTPNSSLNKAPPGGRRLTGAFVRCMFSLTPADSGGIETAPSKPLCDPRWLAAMNRELLPPSTLRPPGNFTNRRGADQ